MVVPDSAKVILEFSPSVVMVVSGTGRLENFIAEELRVMVGRLERPEVLTSEGAREARMGLIERVLEGERDCRLGISISEGKASRSPSRACSVWSLLRGLAPYSTTFGMSARGRGEPWCVVLSASSNVCEVDMVPYVGAPDCLSSVAALFRRRSFLVLSTTPLPCCGPRRGCALESRGLPIASDVLI